MRRAAPRKKMAWSSPANLNWLAASLHLAQAIVVFGLIIWLDAKNDGRGIFPLYKTVHIWRSDPNGTRTAMMASGYTQDIVQEPAGGSLDVRYLIAAFFTLSGLCQAAAGWFDLLDSALLRFGEYAITASCMLMAIAVEAGVDDIYTLQAMFVLTFTTMLLGILADDAPPLPATLAHLGGWLTFLSAYGPILDAFLQSSSRSTASAPGFVHVIVFVQFALFGCFGLVQAHQLFWPALDDEEPGQRSLHYIVLSLTAKSLLAWLILSPIVAR
jgi:hypothetical protein